MGDLQYEHKRLDIGIKNVMMMFMFMQMSQGSLYNHVVCSEEGSLKLGIAAGAAQSVMKKEETISRGRMNCWAEKIHKGRDGQARAVCVGRAGRGRP